MAFPIAIISSVCLIFVVVIIQAWIIEKKERQEFENRLAETGANVDE